MKKLIRVSVIILMLLAIVFMLTSVNPHVIITTLWGCLLLKFVEDMNRIFNEK